MLVRAGVLVWVAEPVLLEVEVPESERDLVPEGVSVEAGLRDGVPLPVRDDTPDRVADEVPLAVEERDRRVVDPVEVGVLLSVGVPAGLTADSVHATSSNSSTARRWRRPPRGPILGARGVFHPRGWRRRSAATVSATAAWCLTRQGVSDARLHAVRARQRHSNFRLSRGFSKIGAIGHTHVYVVLGGVYECVFYVQTKQQSVRLQRLDFVGAEKLKRVSSRLSKAAHANCACLLSLKQQVSVVPAAPAAR